jgi:anhydro-N-acetylmuramic acid kinase
MNAELYIGLMSGTSMDGIDAAVLEFNEQSSRVHETHHLPYPKDLRRELQHLVDDQNAVSLTALGAINVRVARSFSDAVLQLLNKAELTADEIIAIGSHGQTVMHRPHDRHPFSMQLGDPGTIAALTGITVVADFRNSDVALGGQGAPLAPVFHAWAFGQDRLPRAVVNIGGIANATILHNDGHVTGFDTGPGNVLLDGWCAQHQNQPYDHHGMWSATGRVDKSLLGTLLDDGYFELEPPKSTGLDYFNIAWLQNGLAKIQNKPNAADVQATLCELTATTIANALSGLPGLVHVAICGGGAHNADLMSRLQRLLADCPVETTRAQGIAPDWIEAAAFAWLAKQRLHGVPTNLPAVTGASGVVSLGGVYLPSNPL